MRLDRERRERILDAVLEASRRRGSIDFSASELALAAGISRNLIHRYFGGSQALFDELIERECGRVQRRIKAALIECPEGPDEPWERARRVIAAYLASFDGHGVTLRKLVLEDDPSDPVARAVRTTRVTVARSLAEVLGAGTGREVMEELFGFSGFLLGLVRHDCVPPSGNDAVAALCMAACRDALRRAREREALSRLRAERLAASRGTVVSAGR
ncbi:TetR/AcrR family transcriptional regulator [Sutterella sp.]|uniref:TetR/AcrR family transcriptional regulator n=1 Tax=Sutterella sp. TaxID=1981025 RepID=UPI0026E04A0A|nr:TetR/AcrR family transcriptional regulator [Sutterella sp.]MDO5532115.1 TetR/AcrR family transcriptional regulator [Sutterella sp.]